MDGKVLGSVSSRVWGCGKCGRQGVWNCEGGVGSRVWGNVGVYMAGCDALQGCGAAGYRDVAVQIVAIVPLPLCLAPRRAPPTAHQGCISSPCSCVFSTISTPSAPYPGQPAIATHPPPPPFSPASHQGCISSTCSCLPDPPPWPASHSALPFPPLPTKGASPAPAGASCCCQRIYVSLPILPCTLTRFAHPSPRMHLQHLQLRLQHLQHAPIQHCMQVRAGRRGRLGALPRPCSRPWCPLLLGAAGAEG